jgi:hypothetical protein
MSLPGGAPLHPRFTRIAFWVLMAITIAGTVFLFVVFREVWRFGEEFFENVENW